MNTLSRRRHIQVAAGCILSLLMILSAACTVTSDDSDLPLRPAMDPETLDPDSPDKNGAENDACRQHPVVRSAGCDEVSVDGQKFRYIALHPASPAIADMTVLVDPGGPSDLALANATEYLESVRSLLPTANLIMVEEFDSQAPSEACRQTLTDWYGLFRSSPRPQSEVSNTAQRLIQDCKLEVDDSLDTGTNVLSAVVAQEEMLDITVFVGGSFAAVPWVKYGGSERFAESVIARPFPVGATGAEIIQARVDALDEFGPTPSAFSGQGQALKRSLPVNALDAVSARIVVGSGELAAPLSASDIGRLSDGYWGRYAEDAIAPGLLTYYREVCRAVESWPTGTWDGSVKDASGFLTQFHQPCLYIEDAPSHARTLTENLQAQQVQGATREGRTCIVLGLKDTNTPSRLGRTYLDVRGVEVKTSASRDHGSLDGLADCIQVTSARNE